MGQAIKDDKDDKPRGVSGVHFAYTQDGLTNRFNIFVITRGNIKPPFMTAQGEKCARMLVDGFNATLEEEQASRLAQKVSP